jgi:hypothetical protein
MTRAALQVWHSPAQPTARGFEVNFGPFTRREVTSALDSVNWAEVKGSFLILRLSPTDQRGVVSALAAAHDVSAPSRICFAITAGTLAQVALGQLRSDRVGLVLDQVDAETPPSALIHDAIDAVRFSTDFVDGAMSNLRRGVALRAMLGLTRDLGLSTFGPAITEETTVACCPVAFDYVPKGTGVRLKSTDLLTESTAREVSRDNRRSSQLSARSSRNLREAGA